MLRFHMRHMHRMRIQNHHRFQPLSRDGMPHIFYEARIQKKIGKRRRTSEIGLVKKNKNKKKKCKIYIHHIFCINISRFLFFICFFFYFLKKIKTNK